MLLLGVFIGSAIGLIIIALAGNKASKRAKEIPLGYKIGVILMWVLIFGSMLTDTELDSTVGYHWVQDQPIPLIDMSLKQQSPIYAYEIPDGYCYAWRDSQGIRHDEYASAGDTIVNDTAPSPQFASWHQVRNASTRGWLFITLPGNSSTKHELLLPQKTLQIASTC